MSRFRKLAHTLWHCQYHIVWVPKYRFRILTGHVGTEVGRCTRAFSAQLKWEVVELNIQHDHVHLIVLIPPKLAVSDFVGTLNPTLSLNLNRLILKKNFGHNYVQKFSGNPPKNKEKISKAYFVR